MLCPYAFQTMYVHSDLVRSQVEGDTQANVLYMLVPRGQLADGVAEEIKLPSYHRRRTSDCIFIGKTKYQKSHG